MRSGPAVADHAWQTVALGPLVPVGAEVESNLDLPAPGMVSMATGYLDDPLQPVGLLALVAGRAARKLGAGSRPPVAGLDELRDLFAAELGGGRERRHVLVTAGGQPALAACFRSLGKPEDPIIVESPTYQGALAVARTSGLVPIGVPTDGSGLRADLLADTLDATGARLVYSQPKWSNPTGERMTPTRRAEILDLVGSRNVFLIENDAARDLELS